MKNENGNLSIQKVGYSWTKLRINTFKRNKMYCE